MAGVEPGVDVSTSISIPWGATTGVSATSIHAVPVASP